jgi:hypothetical protein
VFGAKNCGRWVVATGAEYPQQVQGRERPAPSGESKLVDSASQPSRSCPPGQPCVRYRQSSSFQEADTTSFRFIAPNYCRWLSFSGRDVFLGTPFPGSAAALTAFRSSLLLRLELLAHFVPAEGLPVVVSSTVSWRASGLTPSLSARLRVDLPCDG